MIERADIVITDNWIVLGMLPDSRKQLKKSSDCQKTNPL